MFPSFIANKHALHDFLGGFKLLFHIKKKTCHSTCRKYMDVVPFRGCLKPYDENNQQVTNFSPKQLCSALLRQGHMIILDLMSERQPQYSRFESFYGQPFIWCMLHNFGGTVEMYGDVESVNKVRVLSQ